MKKPRINSWAFYFVRKLLPSFYSMLAISTNSNSQPSEPKSNALSIGQWEPRVIAILGRPCTIKMMKWITLTAMLG